MKKIYCTFALVLSLSLIGCVQDSEVVQKGEAPEERPDTELHLGLTSEELRMLPIITGDSHAISMDEVALKAQDAISYLTEYDATTRSSKSNVRTIESISALTTDQPSTRGVSRATYLPDTLAYVVNFADDMGFAIVSGDNRVPDPILAIVGSGNLGDSTDNPGLALFLSRAENYITRSIEDFELKKDSMARNIIAKIQPSEPITGVPVVKTRSSESYDSGSSGGSYGPIIVRSISVLSLGASQTTAKVGPMLPVEWGQSDPYNDLVQDKAGVGKESPTGCVATAAAQLMAYWKYPNSIDGNYFKWDSLRMYSGWDAKYTNGLSMSFAPPSMKNSVAILMERIGNKVEMDYGDDVSSAYASRIPVELRDLGYGMTKPYATAPDNYYALEWYYNYDTVIGALNAGRPILARGNAGEIKHKVLGVTIWTEYTDGHAWIIDGYLQRRQQATFRIVYSQGSYVGHEDFTDYLYYDLLHQNWGWDGRHNGFYSEGCFDTTKTPTPSNATRSGSIAGNFQYNIGIFPYIQR